MEAHNGRHASALGYGGWCRPSAPGVSASLIWLLEVLPIRELEPPGWVAFGRSAREHGWICWLVESSSMATARARQSSGPATETTWPPQTTQTSVATPPNAGEECLAERRRSLRGTLDDTRPVIGP
jgi:hypothetical protein